MDMLKLELTDICDGDCIFCDRSRADNGIMPLDMFKSVVDEFPDTAEVMPQFFGESAMHPQFYEALEYLKEKGKRIVFYTNGAHIDPERLAEIDPALVLFSVEAHNKELYEKLRPGLKWKTVLANITKFQELKKTTTTAVRMTVTAENRAIIKEITEYWQDKVDTVFGTNEHPQNREINGTYMDARCHRPLQQMTVKWNGDVVMCCVDVHGDYVVGNVREGARKVWEGKKYQEAREKVNSEDPPDICKTCAFKFKSCM